MGLYVSITLLAALTVTGDGDGRRARHRVGHDDRLALAHWFAFDLARLVTWPTPSREELASSCGGVRRRRDRRVVVPSTSSARPCAVTAGSVTFAKPDVGPAVAASGSRRSSRVDGGAKHAHPLTAEFRSRDPR